MYITRGKKRAQKQLKYFRIYKKKKEILHSVASNFDVRDDVVTRKILNKLSPMSSVINNSFRGNPRFLSSRVFLFTRRDIFSFYFQSLQQSFRNGALQSHGKINKLQDKYDRFNLQLVCFIRLLSIIFFFYFFKLRSFSFYRVTFELQLFAIALSKENM